MRVAIIGIVVAVALPLAYAGATTFSPKCSYHEFYLPYSQENTEHRAESSKIILVGTVKNVEVKLVDQVGDIGERATGQYTISKMPYKFVTVRADEYLVDRTGRHADEFTFRTWANGCVDAFGNFSPANRSDYVMYAIGEKSLLTIQDQHEDGTLTQGLYTYKFDITSRNGTEIVKSNEAAQIPETTLSDLMSEMKVAIERQSVVSPSQEQPAGISLNIEKHGSREFYQDQKVFLPTNFTITNSSAFDRGATIAWPSMGPNHIISQSDVTVFDYYKSRGIDDMTDIDYDEYFAVDDVPQPPAVSGRYFGFEWDQAANDGTRADPGTYSAILTMPVVITENGNSTVVMLMSESESFRILEGAGDDLPHDLSLFLDVTKTELETGEPFNFSLVLVNNQDHPEYFSIDRNGVEFLSAEYPQPSTVREPCYFASANNITDYEEWHMSMYANYFLAREPLQAGKSMFTHYNTMIEAPKRPGTYHLDGSVMLTIADSEVKGKSEFDGVRVSCLAVNLERPIALNVTAPVYEGVSLVLSPDKEAYSRGEAVSFELTIKNESDQSFKLSEVQPTIHIRDALTGRQITDIHFVLDFHEYPTIQPHSKYIVSVPLAWDQKVFDDNGEPRLVEPGQYLIRATFIFPYLESEERAITIS